ncbi:hypothetical protein LZZ85_04580 [Terrimonas sp. NA20]|uniref:Uncharacterized protein n=1 Tax=Terrimonas ginsenosidimutans TaxID=2908004 RepID=A0ABS9KMJ8_9BACT|nr:hypothetical protein [Terrimonas ginsenosidimutans]MCG2613540.1 hypothetical protein [Terrimonas ginsenosidimutans]
MSSTAVLVHSICTILSNYGESVAFGEIATAGLLERQFQLHSLCDRVLRYPDPAFAAYPVADLEDLAQHIAESAKSDWAICTIPLAHHGIEVLAYGHERLWLHYHLLHPPQLPVHWPPWTSCYEIIESFSIFLSTEYLTRKEV